MTTIFCRQIQTTSKPQWASESLSRLTEKLPKRCELSQERCLITKLESKACSQWSNLITIVFCTTLDSMKKSTKLKRKACELPQITACHHPEWRHLHRNSSLQPNLKEASQILHRTNMPGRGRPVSHLKLSRRPFKNRRYCKKKSRENWGEVALWTELSLKCSKSCKSAPNWRENWQLKGSVWQRISWNIRIWVTSNRSLWKSNRSMSHLWAIETLISKV